LDNFKIKIWPELAICANFDTFFKLSMFWFTLCNKITFKIMQLLNIIW
jgi:hypothetical protein